MTGAEALATIERVEALQMRAALSDEMPEIVALLDSVEQMQRSIAREYFRRKREGLPIPWEQPQ